jgi:hypothetical protein
VLVAVGVEPPPPPPQAASASTTAHCASHDRMRIAAGSLTDVIERYALRHLRGKVGSAEEGPHLPTALHDQP